MLKVCRVVIPSPLNLSDGFRKQQARSYYVETRKREEGVWQLKGGKFWTVEAMKEKGKGRRVGGAQKMD